MSAITFINNLKLTHTAELLKNSNLNVTEIAKYLGFSDCFYFSRLFKRKFLESPTSYAKHAYPTHKTHQAYRILPSPKS